MNKLLKGSIAGAAGIALLLGGAGTLAYWNDSTDLDNAGTITAGKLDIVPAAAGTPEAGKWTAEYNGSTPAPLTGTALTNFKIVPGNKLVYTETLTVEAVGTNLSFTLSDNVAAQIPTTITGATITPTFTVTKGSNPAPVAPLTGLTAGTYTVVATITVDFPFDALTVTSQSGNAPLNLSGTAITVQQTL